MNELGLKMCAILKEWGFTLEDDRTGVWTLQRGAVKHVAEVSDTLVYYNVYKPGADDFDKPGAGKEWVDVVTDAEAVKHGEAMDVELRTEQQLQDYLRDMLGPTKFAGGSPEEQEVWREIEVTELALRKLLRTKLRQLWGDRLEENVGRLLGEEARRTLERNREKHAAQYPLSKTTDSLDLFIYCSLGQLAELMLNNELWPEFKVAFRDKRQLEDLFRAITPVRNDQAHFRSTPAREIQRCHLACDDLQALIAQLQ